MRCNKGHRHSITSAGSVCSVGGTVKAERVGGLEGDDEFRIGCLHDRQVAGFSPSSTQPHLPSIGGSGLGERLGTCQLIAPSVGRPAASPERDQLV